MKLVMYIGNDCLDTVPLDSNRIPEPGYIGSLAKSLRQKHAVYTMYFETEPEFFIVPTAEQALHQQRSNQPGNTLF